MKNKAIWIGAFIGAIYAICPWIFGWLFKSWYAVIPFTPAFVSSVFINEVIAPFIGLKISFISLISLNIILWGFTGALIGALDKFVIRKIKKARKNETKNCKKN